MRQGLALATLFTAALVLGDFSANAEPPKAAGKKEIRRDPENKRGISPYMELVVKGETAYVARDVTGAATAFQDAIKLDATKSLAFYRLGEVEREQGKLEDAEKTFELGLAKKGSDDTKAKLLFVLADLQERLHRWQAAKDAWGAYLAHLEKNPKAKGFAASANERLKQIERRMKDEVDYGAVRERIARRIAENEREAIENAKKDKLNK